jgi:hypothetical protein
VEVGDGGEYGCEEEDASSLIGVEGHEGGFPNYCLTVRRRVRSKGLR